MAYAPITGTTDGINDTYNIGMTYTSTTHLTVTLDGVEQSVSFPSSTQFTFSSVPASGLSYTVTRSTPRDISSVISFTSGGTPTDTTLNQLRDWTTHVLDELVYSGTLADSIPDPAGYANYSLISNGTSYTLSNLSAVANAAKIIRSVRNESGGTLTKGTVVYISGYDAAEDLPLIDQADADTSAAMPAMGLVESDINNNSNGSIVTFGLLSGLNTSSYSIGDTLYVSTTAGSLTSTAPTGTNEVQPVATVERVGTSNGQLLINGLKESFPSSSTANVPEAVNLAVRNETGSTITAYKCVYIAGYNNDYPLIATADANDPSKMPVIGMTTESISNNSNGTIRVTGRIVGNVTDNLNTSSYTVKDYLYVDNSGAGTLTNTHSAASTDDVQVVGSVLRSHSTLGEIILTGCGASTNNSLPQLANGYVWKGNGSNRPSQVLPSSFAGAITETFTSGDIAVAAASTGSAAHGLSGVPKLVQAFLRCDTTEAGWAVGDYVNVSSCIGEYGVTIGSDATNIYYSFYASSTPRILNKSTGAISASITGANWKLVIKAYY